ncbi:Z1 domain-containing protein [Jatrophihabitans sp. YIM 134969]
MSDEWFGPSLQAVLRGISGGAPRKLLPRLEVEAEEAGAAFGVDQLAALLRHATDDNVGLREAGLALSRWDCAPVEEAWTEGTPASTTARRALIHRLLGTTGRVAEILDERRPALQRHDIVVANRYTPWYTAARAAERSFYWPRYESYLLDKKEWREDTVARLDATCSDIVRRLADPTSSDLYQTKGLVVGHVQSGKTANFTGVVAKAIDAGYRLVIIMTGTIELLRSQTQRRIDMELVGRQNIVGAMTDEEAVAARVDYQDDIDWLSGRFLDLGTREGKPRINRLTSRDHDYVQQFLTLTPERIHSDKPMWHPDNLYPSGARLVITKKNHDVLGKLVDDIRHNRDTFTELPVLIIDDESDQASVNTVDPEKVKKARSEGKDVADRKAINGHIAEMLKLMPRAQYIGYTATPFANVFVDPADTADIFPKDFVIGLEPPNGYMGVERFSDLDGAEDPTSYRKSNVKAHVRDLNAGDEEVDKQLEELRIAVRMYVLTGAVKLHRAARHPEIKFRHHTMLVHESVKMADARDLRTEIMRLWREEAFTQPRSLRALRDLYETDVKPVIEARAEGRMMPAPDFDDLRDYVGDAVARMTADSGHPVILVNSDKDIQNQQEVLNFDTHDTWRILVGGTKLSRGFTVAGLTVTYFRRATNLGAALTQMGRWFGFREGYEDLTRVYIARKARIGKKEVDLLDAFDGIARDERAFRAQLEQYAGFDEDGNPLLTPLQLRPLVYQHLDWLLPDAKSKMIHARLTTRRENPLPLNGLAAGRGAASLEAWKPAFKVLDLSTDPVRFVGRRRPFAARIGILDASNVVESIVSTPLTDASRQNLVDPTLKFYRQLIKDGLLEDFLVLAPQLDTGLGTFDCGEQSFYVVRRAIRVERGVFGEISDPNHRNTLEGFVEKSAHIDRELAALRLPTRGAMFLYVMQERSSAERYAGVQLYVPALLVPRGSRVLTFEVRMPVE